MRHLRPRAEWGSWSGSALTYAPGGGVELPVGPARALRQAFKQPTTTPVHDDVKGGVLCVQWLGLMIEIGAGRVR
jgi:hypothetical protein